ncbi:MAG: 23S rRNA pseudouridine(1911/1915/1917) synthase RluD [SAR86 cluster bacterium]|nr:23S rRNA pseudouridine(1911/1915/1917) synthase RluD [SAR86 cluster bacterium]
MKRKIVKNIKLSSFHAGSRLDIVIAKEYPEYSRTHIKRWIERGFLTLNGKQVKPRTKIMGSEIVEIRAEEEELIKDLPEDIDIDIIFEDKDLIVVNKASNLVVHPGAGNKKGTLVNGLLAYNKNLSFLPRAGIVHRLDKNTSGLLISAKNESTYINLVRQLKERLISRKYLALVVGEPISGGKIDEPLGRHPRFRTKQAVVKKGKNALTFYKIVEKYRGYSLLEASLSTGRTHQIRVHFSYLGYPIVGDNTYGGKRKFAAGISEMTREKISQFPRQALHASKLQFRHPQTGNKVSLHAPLPRDMSDLISFLKRNV